MARPLTYVPVPVQLRLRLAELRAEGMRFDVAWHAALRLDAAPLITPETPIEERKRGICWPSDTDERASWVQVIQATRAAWQRAYLGSPASGPERAVALLWAMLDKSAAPDRLEHLSLVKAA